MLRGCRRTVLAAVAVASCLALACGGPGGVSEEAAPATDSYTGSSTDAPQRVVSLSPNVTEILFALGVGDRVVGVDDYSTHPPETAGLTRLGGYLDPDLEGIVALDPDLAVLLAAQGELADDLEALGVPTLRVDNQDLEDVEASMVTLGERLGVPQAGRELAAGFAAALAPRPLPGPPRRVMIVAGRTPGRLGEVLVAGPDSYPYELAGRLGADNVFADLGNRYATVGAEEIVARAPGVVVEMAPERLDAAAKEARAEEWRELLGPEVVVAVLDGPETLVPGPRLPSVYDRLEAALR
ncbi:MAG TPA: helical backbone metal receptor [Thermoanaerobaculia bacterium]|nr:helical backbone metal receptor [Thermoanaerobaculia bacterium]